MNSHPLDALRYLLVNLPVMSAACDPPEAEPDFWREHGRIW